MKRTHAAQLGAETVIITEQGWYTNRRGQRVSIAAAVQSCKAATELITPRDWRSLHEQAVANRQSSHPPQLDVTDETTLQAAARLALRGNRVLALNFASARNPGGGFLNGSRAQEESLARSSALYASLLTQPAYYEANRKTHGTLYTDHAVYSPDVPVFRDDDGRLLDSPVELSFLTMPAPNVRAMTPAQVADSPVSEIFTRRIGYVLAFAVARGYRHLVLGAWGCGAFGNEPEMVAALFAEAMQSDQGRQFDEVVFAVFDQLEGRPVHTAFVRALSTGINRNIDEVLQSSAEVDYADILRQAVQSAMEAGAVLRAEFYRPGGPRGSGGHCPADGEAESLIRDRLLHAFPAFGWLAEENGQDKPSADPQRHVWVVDPNDGTDPFQAGMRGSTVSIGLLRDGVPVLGVVYAYAAAGFKDGDLISWAEGQPLTRNGQPVARKPLATALSTEHTVLLSQHGDHASVENAELSNPARFRSVPGIAYRLALVAVGEGEVAMSLSGPKAWDYAGGHALLRAVGGEVVDEVGQPVTYSTDGRSTARRCFGGSLKLAADLTKRPWDKVFRPTRTPASRFDLVWPKRGMLCTDAALLDRAIGCLVGQLAGDSLGGLVEFQSVSTIRSAYPDGVRRLADGGQWSILAGQPTDDSEMAMMLARSIVESGTYLPAAALQAYLHWSQSHPFDMGGTTRQAMAAAGSAISRGDDAVAAVAKFGSHESQANGALMRVSPLAIFAHAADAERAMAWARADAALSHPNVLCSDANAIFVATLARAIATGESPASLYRFACKLAEQTLLRSDVRQWLIDAEHGVPADFGQQMGWVRIAFQNAFYQLLHAKSVEGGLADTIARGGDTDTNAAIAGAMLGAVQGVSALPPQWIDRVLTCRSIKAITPTRHPRPREFWPVDVMYLAERLIVLGNKGSLH